MSGMDAGPWTELGTLAWFLGVWVAMTAAVMLPSAAPTVTLYSRLSPSRTRLSPLAFVAGYVLTWSTVGLFAFVFASVGDRVAGNVLAWDRAGRWAAGITLLAAAAYELTPLKDACLGKCRSPLGFLVGSWREGASGALR